ncbi:hypothetical protein ACFLTC_00070 [Chloroflexota bacterium]
MTVERGIDIDPNDLRLYLHLRGSYIGDLYFFVADLERSLHTLMRRVLAAEYGEAGDMWWHQGVPEKVREGCLGRQGRKGAHPYSYTTFLNLKDILEDNWSTFARYLPEDETVDRRGLMDAFFAVNRVRNKVMHPIRERIPSDEDFKSVRQLRRRLARKHWRIP